MSSFKSTTQPSSSYGAGGVAAQLAGIRAEHKAKYQASREKETDGAMVTMPTAKVSKVKPMTVKPRESPDPGIVKRARSGSSDVEYVGESGTKRMKSSANGVSTSMDPPPSPPRFPKPRIFLTRTQGRLDGPALANTITLGQIIDKRAMCVDGEGGISFSYSFFIGQDEFFEYLPLRTTEESPFYVGRDLAQDGVACEIARSLRIPPNNGIYHGLSSADHARVTDAAEKYYKNQYGQNFRCFYAQVKSGSPHSKFGAIVYPGFLRIFITSANLMSLDTVHSDNHWFVVDLPRLPSDAPSMASKFKTQFFDHAAALGLPKLVIDSLFLKYDWSALKGVDLITSEPGTHNGEEVESYGALRLRKVARRILGGGRDVDIEVCTASIGGCQADWMAGMGHALSGGWRDVDSAKLPDLQIVFCTRRDVESARQASQDGAAQMGCHLKWPQASDELKSMFHHYKSKDQASDGQGEGCLFHCKQILVFDKTDHSRPLYVYIGSANFSKSAWGKPKKLKNRKEPTYSLSDTTNFEMGVVIRGDMIEEMLEEGSHWEDMITYQRDVLTPFRGNDKPYNSESWVNK